MRDPAGEFVSALALLQYNALYRPASSNNNARIEFAFQRPDGSMYWSGCVGAARLVMRLASQRDQNDSAHDLMDSSAAIAQTAQTDPSAFRSYMDEVRQTQREHEYEGRDTFELPGRERWGVHNLVAGQSGLQQADLPLRTVQALGAVLSGSKRFARGPGAATRTTPDMFTLTFHRPGMNDEHEEFNHIISGQRRFVSDDFRTDEYTIYDNNFGAFRYDNFAQMAGALRAALSGVGRITTPANSAYIRYYSRTEDPNSSRTLQSLRNNAGNDPGAGPSNPNQGTHSSTVPPDPTLPPPNAGSLLGMRLLDETKKRSAQDYAQPRQLFRPSTFKPEQVRANSGFSTESTALEHVNLGTHASVLEAEPHIFDSSGYLGTFRDQGAALNRLPAQDGKPASGYLYDTAPSPNMVNVDASLGGKRDSGEFAAMGRIDWTQIRGWREVKDGQVGAYQRNPDYRWDVYDQTRTAGTQPQLARYRSDDPALSEPLFKSWVSKTKQDDGSEHVSLTQNANTAAARFYGHATNVLKYMEAQTKDRANYRGAFQIDADVDAGPEGKTGGLYAYNPSSTSWVYSGPAVKYANAVSQFRYGEDGRFHSASEPNRVLRVNSNGDLFLGNLPDEISSRNGVFEYTADHRLKHVEDGKYLTRSGYDKGVTVAPAGSGSASQWTVNDERQQPQGPFSVQRPPSYRGNVMLDPADGASSNHLYVYKMDEPETMQTYIGNSGNDSNNTNVRRFVYGEDGRFHDANDPARTLGVDSNGQVKLGKQPDPASRNGVFRYDSGRLIHEEDGKYLTRGGNQSALTVTGTDYGAYSRWRMNADNGMQVGLPAVNLNTFDAYPVDARQTLNDFVKDPDSTLPPGTNRFVTTLPGADASDTWEGSEDKRTGADKAARWLADNHAAWLFKDGYYGLASGPQTVEIRRLDGAKVGDLRTDPATGRTQWTTQPASPRSTFAVPDAIWSWVKQDESLDAGASAPAK